MPAYTPLPNGTIDLDEDDEDTTVAFNAVLFGCTLDNIPSYMTHEAPLKFRLNKPGPHFPADLPRQWATGSGLLHLVNMAIRSEQAIVMEETLCAMAAITQAVCNLLLHAPYIVVTDAESLAIAEVTYTFVPCRNPFTTIGSAAATEPNDKADAVCVDGCIFMPGRLTHRSSAPCPPPDPSPATPPNPPRDARQAGLRRWQGPLPEVRINGTDHTSLFDVRATPDATKTDPDHGRKRVAMARSVKATFKIDLGIIMSATAVADRPAPLVL